jgi:hypothetical protein
MSKTRAMIYAGELSVAVGAGVKDNSLGSFLMVAGLCAIIEGLVAIGEKSGIFDA